MGYARRVAAMVGPAPVGCGGDRPTAARGAGGPRGWATDRPRTAARRITRSSSSRANACGRAPPRSPDRRAASGAAVRARCLWTLHSGRRALRRRGEPSRGPRTRRPQGAGPGRPRRSRYRPAARRRAHPTRRASGGVGSRVDRDAAAGRDRPRPRPIACPRVSRSNRSAARRWKVPVAPRRRRGPPGARSAGERRVVSGCRRGGWRRRN